MSNQADIFSSDVIYAQTSKKVKRFSGNFKLPSSVVMFCHKCNFVPRLCECLVSQKEADKVANEINNFFKKEG